MAGSSPLAGLRDRAASLLDLVRELAAAYSEYERSANDFPRQQAKLTRRIASAWEALRPAIIEVGESLPPEASPVADWIRDVGRVTRRFDGRVRERGLAEALFGSNWDGLIRIADEGNALFASLKVKHDPFAFAVQAPGGNASGIDSTPTLPKPPAHFIESAARDIPNILANVPPRHDGAIELVASHLARRLQDAGHTLAAAQWAVHESVRAGRLQPGLIEVEFSSVGRVVGGTMRHLGGPDDRRMVWSGGGKGTVGIPKGKPAPFDSFKVTATESLWTWWRSSEVETPNQAAQAIKTGEGDFIERLLAGPDDAELSPRELASLEAYLKQPVPLAQLQQEGREQGKSPSAQRRNKLKLIRDFNRVLNAVTPAANESRPVADAGQGEPAEATSETTTPMKTKRSTERGEGRAKLIAVLTKHHKYADGGCLNLEPIGNNALARQANVSTSTATAFFNKQFNGGKKRGYANYRVICRDAGRLAEALKVLNDDFSPCDLYGRRPPGEDDHEDEE